MLQEPLASYLSRFVSDAASLEQQLRDPVLVYHPPLSDSDHGFRFRTESGVAHVPPDPGEPVVLLVRKAKDNAFRRGVTVGRTSNNDLVLDDSSVSRFHAWFQQREGGGWSVADAGSKNGTRVDGEPLPAKKQVLLDREARIRFGKIDVVFFPPQAFLKLLRRRVRS